MDRKEKKEKKQRKAEVKENSAKSHRDSAGSPTGEDSSPSGTPASAPNSMPGSGLCATPDNAQPDMGPLIKTEPHRSILALLEQHAKEVPQQQALMCELNLSDELLTM